MLPAEHLPTVDLLNTLREAVASQHKVRIVYTDLEGRRSESVLRPLCCVYSEPVWVLSAWCEARAALHNFRVDLISDVQPLEERFSDEPGKTLADLQQQAESRMSERDSSTDA